MNMFLRFQLALALGLSAALCNGEAAAQMPVADASVTSAPGPWLSERKLDVWKSADFRAEFLRSYLSETEVEPPISADEQDVILQMRGLLADEELARAERLVNESRAPTATAMFDFLTAHLMFQQERFAEAAAAYASATAKFPNFRRAWNALAQVRFRLADYPAAITAFSEVIRLGGGTAISYGLLGVSHSRLEDWVAAESAFRVATMLQPTVRDWKMGLAECLFRQQRFADAAALFGTLILADPDRADFWLAQGEAYARMGRTDDAAMNFEMCDQLGGSSFESLCNLGDIYAQQEVYGRSVDAYLRALRLEPEAELARLVRVAQFMSGKGAHRDTRALVVGIEEIRGEKLSKVEKRELLELRYRIAFAEGGGDAEMRVLQQMVALDPLDGHALILLGQYMGRNDEPERAAFLFERAANIEGFEADAKVRHAQLLVGQGDYRAALPLLRRAQEIAPRDNVQEFLVQVERATKNR